ncbi:hypothetical protein B0J13DRAFT_595253 [Dactylonectria estremocensis]|uniref:Uncharacterized protein n=1 Tax=Dactylonectria estremocensis TaxID=1079267 RepID=A0A9P9J2X4_9HYPO|nr:hypothetical protein B0J13DRAFT_595253 [Dactylonectria estremocensis]
MVSLPVRSANGTPSAGNSSGKFIAIGIDFGTTFSGVSWAFSEQPDKVYEISEWPAAFYNNQNEIQVPTQYDLKSGKWGYEVTPDMTPMKWFKLLLLNDDDIVRDEIRNSKSMQEARAQLHLPKAPNATQVVGFYLKKLWEHTYAKLRAKLEIDNLPLRVAITVPAIWPPYAQKAMREAAKIAGITDERDIGATTLDLVQEPEAAGLSILFERSDLPEIQAGESFVVCDAGGGTVDVISYTVISNRPFQLKECVKGDGKLSGAIRIDEAFEAHLKGKTKLRLQSLEQAEYNTFVTEDWERGAKRSFSNEKEPQQFFLRPPSKAYKKMDRWRGKDSFSISNEEMKTFFSKSLTGIRGLVNEQCKQVQKATEKPPKKILLVGGLGSSLYIHSMLDEQFKGIVLRPLQAWSAVAHGAVIRLLRDKISTQSTLTPSQKRILATLPVVTARKSRYSYGIVVKLPVHALSDFDSALDEMTLDPEGDMVTRRMQWYLRKGDEVSKRSPVLVSYHQFFKNFAPDKCTFAIKYSSSDFPPKRVDPTVLDLCRVECDWDKPFWEWTQVGHPSEGWRRCDDLALAMRFEGEPKWKVRVGSKQAEHDVQVEYMG